MSLDFIFTNDMDTHDIQSPNEAHYHKTDAQPIDLLSEEEKKGFFKGNCLKYISRYNYKGSPIEDLLKARRYLDWLIELESAANRQ